MHQRHRPGRPAPVGASRNLPTRRSSRARRALFPFVGEFFKFGLQPAHHGGLVSARVVRGGSCFKCLSPRLGLELTTCLPRDTPANQLTQQLADRLGFLRRNFSESGLQNRFDAERDGLHLRGCGHTHCPVCVTLWLNICNTIRSLTREQLTLRASAAQDPLRDANSISLATSRSPLTCR